MKKLRIIVIGGLSAGPSAAAKARRVNEDAEILLFEKTSNISYATCGIPYALSGKIKSREKLLVVKPELLKNRFKIDVHLNEPVFEIDPNQKIVKTDLGEYYYDKLVFATGGRAILPRIQNIEICNWWTHAKSLEDFDKILKDDVMKTAKHVTVIGAGLIGLETAENLIEGGKKVTVIEFADHILTPWDQKFSKMAQAVLRENNIDLKLGITVSAVDSEKHTLTLSNGEILKTDYLLIGISTKPNTEMLVSKGAQALPNGALIVNEKMETSIPGIYAAGDCASINDLVREEMSWYPMGTHSNKGGRAAGANAAGGSETFEGAYATTIMKVFNYTIARTGSGPKALTKAGIDFQSTFIVTGTTPGFYPDQKDIFIEIYYDPNSGRLLGAELFGEKGVDKRVDVLSTAIYAKLTVNDLTKLDLAYAPPYSPAKDPVIVAGYVAGNTMKNNYTELNTSMAEELIAKEGTNLEIVDVRNPIELTKEGKIENSINIPLDELRDNLNKIDPNKKLLIYCARGMRGYLASLILAHNGFEDVNNLAGGYMAWKNIVGERKKEKMTASSELQPQLN